MADRIETSYDLKFIWLFEDGDTRTQTMKYPTRDITTTQIKELETLIINGGGESTILVGDKTGAPFRRINSVTRITTRTTTLDINS